MKSWNVKARRGLEDCLPRCSHSMDKETKPRGVTQLTQSQTRVGNEASAFVLPARALFTLVFMRFGKRIGSWEKVPHKSKNTKWPFSKSFPFLRVLAPIQHDDCCSSCSSICATVNHVNGGTRWGPENEARLHYVSRSLGSPL